MTISPLYGDPTAEAPPWREIDRRLTEAQLYWLVSVRHDGRPHAVPLCGLWRDGAFWFCTGDAEQKMRNLDHDRRVTVLTGPLGAGGWGVGKDIAVEGRAEDVTDPALLEELARGWLEKYDGDWRFEVRDHRFVEVSGQGDDQDDGRGGGARVFRVDPDKTLVFGDDHGQTTYRRGEPT